MSALGKGRASFDRRAWADAFEAFAAAEGEGPLSPEDLERLALSAGLTGRDEAFLGALERTHKECVDADKKVPAARAAFWIGFFLTLFGQPEAAGWLARAGRLVEKEDERCAVRGYVLVPAAYRHLRTPDDEAARSTAKEAAEIGERCGDRDLVALARAVEGRALLRLGRTDAGLALLDETMLAVTSDELSPLVTGIVYCNVLTCCQEGHVLDRARAWTLALAGWCSEQPQLVTFTGHCLVHRAEILELTGAWQDASEEVRQIRERTVTGDPEVFGDACYREGELLRLRGELNAAEDAYRLATEKGRDAQPGLALLRLAQGQSDAAASSIRRVLATTTPRWQRAHFLPAAVEIFLAAGELDEARRAGAELEAIARDHRTEILVAMAAQARGALSLADGDARAAVEPLRQAFVVWNRAGAPYVAARIRVLLARALDALGDRDGAELENAAAQKVFAELGAATASARSDVPTHGLSKRELEVVRLLASGKTNKVIGRDLFVSERTIDRHVSNIFAKIGVSTRAAATAFAYENDLVRDRE